MTQPPGRKPQCPTCRLRPAACICDRLPRIRLPVKVIVIQHARERHSQSNTGSLVCHVLANSELAVHGHRLRPLDLTLLGDPTTEHVVLFPLPGAPVVSPALLDLPSCRRLAFVVLDATWAQARRMSFRIPGLRKLRFVRLPPDVTPCFRLRKPRQRGQLGTAEAVAMALDLLGESQGAAALGEALRLAAGEVLKVRGKVPRGGLGVVPPRRRAGAGSAASQLPLHKQLPLREAGLHPVANAGRVDPE